MQLRLLDGHAALHQAGARDSLVRALKLGGTPVGLSLTFSRVSSQRPPVLQRYHAHLQHFQEVSRRPVGPVPKVRRPNAPRIYLAPATTGDYLGSSCPSRSTVRGTLPAPYEAPCGVRTSSSGLWQASGSYVCFVISYSFLRRAEPSILRRLSSPKSQTWSAT